jgi:alpha-tubulin suppressor-like RCC1 family protein
MADVKVIATGDYHAIALKTDNSLWAAGSLGRRSTELNTQINDYIPVKIATDVRAISAGGGHTLFIKNDNSVWSMGYNSYGQLANGYRTGYSATPGRVDLP